MSNLFKSFYLFLLVMVSFSLAEISVTFNVNSSSVEGFTDSTSTVQIRGGIDDNDGNPDTWDQSVLQWSASSVEMTNTGGDYWTVTVLVPDEFAGRALNWKIGATLYDLQGNPSDFWEDGANRVLTLGGDIFLPLAYVSNAFDPPYAPTDSVDIYFRVNMSQNAAFNPETDILSLVGHFPRPGATQTPGVAPTNPNEQMWSPGTFPLTREGEDSDYWSYHLKITHEYMAVIQSIKIDAPWPESARGMFMYRLAIGNDWNNTENLGGAYFPPNNENRVIYFKNTTGDTTLAWKWWNDAAEQPFEGIDSVQITFNTDLTQAILNNGFVPGDSVIVRAGWNNTATAVVSSEPMEKSGFGNDYSTTMTVVTELSLNLEYNYYIVKDGQEYREIFFDFSDPETGSSAEKRKIEITSTTLVVNDDSDDFASIRRAPKFRNLEFLSQDVLVTFEVDARPAYYQVLSGSTLLDIQGSFNISVADTVVAWGLRINGPATGEWGSWGLTLRNDTTRWMYDDGSHGDRVAGDTVYTRQYQFTSADRKGQEFKFGIGGGDNEGGFGNNHIENIDDASNGYTIFSEFGSIDPLFYNAWDFSVTDIEDKQTFSPAEFELAQNFPNPFNPVTSISFALPKAGQVSLEIYNVTGQKVKTLINSDLRAGKYTQVWSGKNDYGVQVASGIYFYKLTAKDFSAVKKMILVK